MLFTYHIKSSKAGKKVKQEKFVNITKISKNIRQNGSHRRHI